jgi:hypothetical protein
MEPWTSVGRSTARAGSIKKMEAIASTEKRYLTADARKITTGKLCIPVTEETVKCATPTYPLDAANGSPSPGRARRVRGTARPMTRDCNKSRDLRSKRPPSWSVKLLPEACHDFIPVLRAMKLIFAALKRFHHLLMRIVRKLTVDIFHFPWFGRNQATIPGVLCLCFCTHKLLLYLISLS